jgi:hypothetical protein
MDLQLNQALNNISSQHKTFQNAALVPKAKKQVKVTHHKQMQTKIV